MTYARGARSWAGRVCAKLSSIANESRNLSPDRILRFRAFLQPCVVFRRLSACKLRDASGMVPLRDSALVAGVALWGADGGAVLHADGESRSESEGIVEIVNALRAKHMSLDVEGFLSH